MSQPFDPVALLAYLGGYEDDDLPYDDFVQAFRLFLALLEKMKWHDYHDAFEDPPGRSFANIALYMDDEQRSWLNRIAEAANRSDEAAIVQAIPEELYHAQKEPRFGEINPELLNLDFWKFMVRRRLTAYRGRVLFDPAAHAADKAASEILNFDGRMALSEEEKAARTATFVNYKYGKAVWSFDRYGHSFTKLADGREVWIGGAHEDSYDDDFYIYNDVIVIHPNLEIDIYGYPIGAFRPIDFHSATLAGDSIYIIGGLGYHGIRQPGETPVYRLDCQSYQIETIATTGDNPGWIHKHQATYIPERNAIRVTQGEIFVSFEGQRPYRKNRSSYWLDLATGQWSRGKGKGG